MREDADYYQKRKDDVNEWGEADATRPERRRLAAMVSVRLSPEEEATIRAAAVRAGESLSNFLRTAALAMLETRVPAVQTTTTSSRGGLSLEGGKFVAHYGPHRAPIVEITPVPS